MLKAATNTLLKQTRTVEQAEKNFKKSANKASGLFIPVDRFQHFQLTLPTSAKRLADERGLNPAHETLSDLYKQIQKLVVEDKRTKWQSAVDKCDQRTGTSHLWRLVKGLSVKPPNNSPYKSVRFTDKTYLDSKMIAKQSISITSIPSKLRLRYECEVDITSLHIIIIILLHIIHAILSHIIDADSMFFFFQ